VVVHDFDSLDLRLSQLQEAFPQDTLHAVAVKANPLPKVLRFLVERGCGLETASRGELELAFRAGCPPERMVFDSPAKTVEEIRFALQHEILLNANSGAELERISQFITNGKVGLRINPLVAPPERADTTMVAVKGSKFGVPLPEAEALLEKHPFVNGLHLHIGSQVATLEDLVEGGKRVVELADRFPHLEWLDIGGGLPTRYRESDPGLGPDTYLNALREAAPSIDRYQLTTEIGRALHAGCGWAASRVEYVEPGRAIIHLGADFCLRECYQGDKWFHQFRVFDSDGQEKTGPTQPVNLFGPLCFSGDLVAEGVPLPPLEPGDIVVMCDVGGYTLGMWSRYCSRAVPEVVGRFQGDWSVLRKRETPEQIVSFWEPEGLP